MKANHIKKNITTKSKSVINILKTKNQISDSTLASINSLSIEDLIAVKLELSANHLNNRLYGFDIWRNSSYIVKDALLKFAISNTNSKKDAARFLNLDYASFSRLIKKFKVDKYFDRC